MAAGASNYSNDSLIGRCLKNKGCSIGYCEDFVQLRKTLGLVNEVVLYLALVLGWVCHPVAIAVLYKRLKRRRIGLGIVVLSLHVTFMCNTNTIWLLSASRRIFLSDNLLSRVACVILFFLDRFFISLATLIFSTMALFQLVSAFKPQKFISLGASSKYGWTAISFLITLSFLLNIELLINRARPVQMYNGGYTCQVPVGRQYFVVLSFLIPLVLSSVSTTIQVTDIFQRQKRLLLCLSHSMRETIKVLLANFVHFAVFSLPFVVEESIFHLNPDSTLSDCTSVKWFHEYYHLVSMKSLDLLFSSSPLVLFCISKSFRKQVEDKLTKYKRRVTRLIRSLHLEKESTATSSLSTTASTVKPEPVAMGSHTNIANTPQPELVGMCSHTNTANTSQPELVAMRSLTSISSTSKPGPVAMRSLTSISSTSKPGPVAIRSLTITASTPTTDPSKTKLEVVILKGTPSHVDPLERPST